MQRLGIALEAHIMRGHRNVLPLLTRNRAHARQDLIAQLDSEPKVEFMRACNQAAWAVGEVALCYVHGKQYNETQWITYLVNCTHMPNVFTCI